jgi:hypothetical protein
MGACSFTSASATVAAGGLPERLRSCASIAGPPRMIASIVAVASDAPSAPGMSMMRRPSSTRPGRGVPEGNGE